MSDSNTYPVLYILMRTDILSLNSGKAMAQASHAANAFVHSMNKNSKPSLKAGERLSLFKEWEKATPQGFGTVLCLAVTEAQMRTAVKVGELMGFVTGVLNDPTYPYITSSENAKLIPESVDTAPRHSKGTETVMFRSEDTCAWVFGDKNDPMLEAVVGRFKLHP